LLLARPRRDDPRGRGAPRDAVGDGVCRAAGGSGTGWGVRLGCAARGGANRADATDLSGVEHDSASLGDTALREPQPYVAVARFALLEESDDRRRDEDRRIGPR